MSHLQKCGIFPHFYLSNKQKLTLKLPQLTLFIRFGREKICKYENNHCIFVTEGSKK